MYMRGIAPSESVQQAEGLLNCAAYMPGERAPDNPWDALKRILKRRSESYLSDGMTVAKSPGLIVRGMGRLAIQNPRFPQGLSRFIVDQVIRFRPNMAVEEFMTGGVPHKLVRLPIEVICEQAPDPENRVTLSSHVDRFGVPYPEVRWKLGELERRTIMRFAELMCLEFEKAGLPVPVLEGWVRQNDFEKASIIDMGHTAGTTRMSDDPGNGVVDRNCKVHGIKGLYVAGASVFPTSGHANPTLMIVALALRLADHLRHRSAT
ncbi:GMC family oxidoreductase [Roseovarius sp. B08]|uniref:GMC family oxidoreductase n=1 Tax=Roseovarius sp. B08 TaxID=3449223 RepID=UPI003EDBF709